MHLGPVQRVYLAMLSAQTGSFILLGQQLQVAPPAGVGEGNQQHWAFTSAGGRREAGPAVQASLFQRQRLLLSGQILQHTAMMERHLLQGLSVCGCGERNSFQCERIPFTVFRTLWICW